MFRLKSFLTFGSSWDFSRRVVHKMTYHYRLLTFFFFFLVVNLHGILDLVVSISVFKFTRFSRNPSASVKKTVIDKILKVLIFTGSCKMKNPVLIRKSVLLLMFSGYKSTRDS